jgi:hypothetical protein
LAATNADKIIAISKKQTKKILFTFLNVDPDKIEVIYQGCPPHLKKNILMQKKKR